MDSLNPCRNCCWPTCWILVNVEVTLVILFEMLANTKTQDEFCINMGVLPGGGGSYKEKTGMLVGNFEFNP